MTKKSKRFLNIISGILASICLMVGLLPASIFLGVTRGGTDINRAYVEAYYSDKYETFKVKVADVLVGFGYVDELTSAAFPYEVFYIDGVKWINSKVSGKEFQLNYDKFSSNTILWFEKKLGLSKSDFSEAQLDKIDKTATAVYDLYEEAIGCPWYELMMTSANGLKNLILGLSAIALVVFLLMTVILYKNSGRLRNFIRNFSFCLLISSVLDILASVFYLNYIPRYYLEIVPKSYSEIIRLCLMRGFEYGCVVIGVTGLLSISGFVILTYNKSMK